MESTRPNTLVAEYAKVIGQFKLPGIDPAAMLEARRKDLEALANANSTVLAGLQALGQKQADIVRGALGGVQSLFGQPGTADKPSVAGTGERVQQALHNALVDVQELADTAYRAQADSVAIVAKRTAERVEEFKALFQPKK